MLRDINLEVKPGMKVCLVGPPGSGISLFFLALTGEAVLSQGSLKLNGKLSYLSKNLPVFISGTIKENILLSEKYEAKKFSQILNLVELNLSRFAAGE